MKCRMSVCLSVCLSSYKKATAKHICSHLIFIFFYSIQPDNRQLESRPMRFGVRTFENTLLPQVLASCKASVSSCLGVPYLQAAKLIDISFIYSAILSICSRVFLSVIRYSVSKGNSQQGPNKSLSVLRILTRLWWKTEDYIHLLSLQSQYGAKNETFRNVQQ